MYRSDTGCPKYLFDSISELKCQVHYAHFNGFLTTIVSLEVKNGIHERSDISTFKGFSLWWGIKQKPELEGRVYKPQTSPEMHMQMRGLGKGMRQAKKKKASFVNLWWYGGEQIFNWFCLLWKLKCWWATQLNVFLFPGHPIILAKMCLSLWHHEVD